MSEKATEKKPAGAAEFLKNLPSYKKENFSRFVADASGRSTNQTNRADTRLVCGDETSSQTIVTEKTSILLRYLHDHWDRKANSRKRTVRKESDESEPFTALHGDGASSSSGNVQSGQPPRKMPRTL